MNIRVIRDGKPIANLDHITVVSSITNNLNYTPHITLTIPMSGSEVVDPWDEIKYSFNDKTFHGIVTDITPDYAQMTTQITATHIVQEWEKVQVPTNRAVKLKQLWQVVQDEEFVPKSWNADLQDGVDEYYLDYVFSRESQLEALTTITELTPYSHWRVSPFIPGRNIEVGSFGRKTKHIFSAHRHGNGITLILSVASTGCNFSRVKNKAVVYAQKSDTGMSSITLRDIYIRPEYQHPEFPIEIIRDDANNERTYDYSDQYPAIAPNQNIEYAIRDLESIKVEGLELETTISLSTISPFAVNDEAISDTDRIKAARVAYEVAIKQLIQLRRYSDMQITVTEILPDLNVGDKVYVEFIPEKALINECIFEQYQGKGYVGYKYVKSIQTDISIDGVETSILTLDDYIRIDRLTAQTNSFVDTLNRLAERSAVDGKTIGRVQLQRQNQVVDDYGTPHRSDGSKDSPAYFIISVSPDMINLVRFEFRITIKATRVAIGNMEAIGSAIVVLDHAGLAMTEQGAQTTSPVTLEINEAGELYPPMHDHTVPGHTHNIDAHTHGTQPHTHNIDTGVTDVPVQANTFGISINGHDITSLIQSLYPGMWLTGQGVFPSSVSTFDWLKIASNAPEHIAQSILQSRNHRIEISGNGAFTAEYISYLKYPYVSR